MCRAFAGALPLLCCALAPALAEEPKALNGIALVIGEQNYQHLGRLTNPGNDAREIQKLLSDLGFEARLVADRDARKLTRELERFTEDAEGADVALLYYSGHGIEAGGENFLVPVDASVDALDDAGGKLVPLSAIVEKLKATVPAAIVLLGAYRSNPFPAGASVRLCRALSGVGTYGRDKAAFDEAETVCQGALAAFKAAGNNDNAEETTQNLDNVRKGRKALR